MSSNQPARSILPESFEGTELSFQTTKPQLSQNTLLARTQRNTELCCPCLGVVCACVCVSQTTHCGHTLSPSYKHSGRHINWHRHCVHVSPSDNSINPHYEHLRIFTSFLCIFSPHPSHNVSRARNKNRTPMHTQTAHTGLFSSRSCVRISNRACWERTNTLTRKDRLATEGANTHTQVLLRSWMIVSVSDKFLKATWPDLTAEQWKQKTKGCRMKCGLRPK